MASKSILNTFTKGMNKDIDKSMLPQGAYREALNMRVSSDDGGTSGAIENIKGNEALWYDEIMAGQWIVGTAKVRDWLVVFTTNNAEQSVLDTPINGTFTGAANPGGGEVQLTGATGCGVLDDFGTPTCVTITDSLNYDGTYEVSTVTSSTFNIEATYGGTDSGKWYWSRNQIYAFKISKEGELVDNNNVYINPTLNSDYPALIYDDIATDSTDNLDFLFHHRFKTVGRYETEDIAKVYWTDGYNPVRWVNIFDTDVANQNADRFDMIPNATLDKANISSLITGYIPVGSVQYTYQLYKSSGSETLFAPLSHLISLTADNENLADSQHYEGFEQGVSSGKGVKLTVDNTNTGYNFIRGIAIHYDSLNGTPTIRVFEEKSIDSDVSSTITLTDIGETLGTYTAVELSVADRSLFKAEDLETKDNYLFAANIQEDYFDIGDWDARSYRFEASDDTKLYHDYVDSDNYTYLDITSGTTLETYTWTEYTVTGGGAPVATGNTYLTEDIPETYDCINRFNDYDNDGSGSHQHKYQSDGSTLGAEGLNISVDFQTKAILIDDDVTRFDHTSTDPASPHYQVTESESDNTSYTGFASPYISSQYVGYMRDEIYRFGIVFYDSKGRRSYVRWICDLRMPNANDLKITEISSGDVQANTVIPRFNVHGDLPSNAAAYQIVRVKREGFKDRNILAQGLLTSTRLVTTHEFPEFLANSDANANANHEYVYLNSPEISINKNLTYSSGDELVAVAQNVIGGSVIGTATDGGTGTIFEVTDSSGFVDDESSIVVWGTTDYNGTWAITDIPDATHVTSTDVAFTTNQSGSYVKYGGFYKNTGQGSYITISKVSEWEGHSLATTSIDSIDTCRIISPSSATYNLGGTNSAHILDHTAADTFFKGTSLLVKHSGSGTWYPANDSNSDKYRFLCNYRRNNWLSQYGGNTYEDRSRNTYQAAGNIETSKGQDNVYGGDTYICYFDYFNLIGDLSQLTDDYQMEGIMFPVETTINLNFKHSKSDLNKLLPASTSSQELKLEMTQETGGTQVDNSDREYEQETDLYLYNTVYSQENILIPFLAKPVDDLYSIESKYDTRIRYSDLKIDGEVSDSWFKFRTNNFIDLDKAPGPINNIEAYKNHLMFWQDHAFGIVSVNARTVLSTEEGTGLVLGTGGLLDHVDYISDDIGNANKFGVVVSDEACYWLDNYNREIYRFTTGVRGVYSRGGGSNSLATAKGMSSYLKNFDNIANVHAVIDRKNRGVTFTIWPGRSGTLGGAPGYNMGGNVTGMSAPCVISINGRYYVMKSIFQPLGIENYETPGDALYFAPEVDKVTFNFNETIDAFDSFYSFTPGHYIDFDHHFFTTENSLSNRLFRHNTGVYGAFYETDDDFAFYDSYLITVFNPDYQLTKVFDNFEWVTEVYYAQGQEDHWEDFGNYFYNRFEETWNKIHCYNDYQNTSELDLAFRTTTLNTEVPYDRRERGFTMAVPRNAFDRDVSDNYPLFSDSYLDLARAFRERMRDKYLTVKFTYENNSATNSYKKYYRFSCPFIGLTYRHSIR